MLLSLSLVMGPTVIDKSQQIESIESRLRDPIGSIGWLLSITVGPILPGEGIAVKTRLLMETANNLQILHNSMRKSTVYSPVY